MGSMLFLAANLFFFTGSLAHNSQTRWRDYFSRTFTGHYHLTTFSGPDVDHTFPALKINDRYVPDAAVEYLNRHGVPWAPRIRQGAAVYNDETSSFEGELACLVGIHFERELPLLDNIRIVEGGVDPDNPRGVLVWEEYARSHNWQLGQEITLYVTDVYFYNYPYLFEITGIYNHHEGSVLEGVGFWMVYPMVLTNYERIYDISALYLKEAEAGRTLYSEIAVWDAELEHLDELQRILERAGPDTQILFAEEGFGSIKGIVEAIRFVSAFVHFFILAIIFFSVSNLNLIGFFDRQREIGSILAMGAKPSWVVKLLLTETMGFTLVVFHLAIGFYAILPRVFPSGLDFGKLNIFFADHWFRFVLVPASIAPAALIIGLTMLASVLYPVYLSTKLDPVQVFQEGNL